MKKQCQYVLLPTDEASKILLRSTGEFSCSTEFILKYNEGSKLQHLYILSDDEIKKDDWYYDTKINAIRQYLDKESTDYIHYCKKIIATTDESIGNLVNGFDNSIPSISQLDIEYIISLYNGNVVRCWNCGAKKEIVTGMCSSYGRFPGRFSLEDMKKAMLILVNIPAS